MDRMNVNVSEHVTLYQSLYFEKFFPKDNFAFERIIQTKKTDDQNQSILLMRERMLTENNFTAGIFIGGMEGIDDEFELFLNTNPNAITLPIASTGAAAKIIYNKYKHEKNFDERLLNDYAYMALFRDLLSKYI